MAETPLRSTIALLLGGCIGVCALGCAGSGPNTGGGRTLTADDFRTPPGGVAAADEGEQGGASALAEAPSPEAEDATEVRSSLLNPGAADIRRVDARQAREGIDDVAVLSGSPTLTDSWLLSIEDEAAAAARPRANENGLVHAYPIDALVGHINGRPLFASEFFEQMDARLRSEAQRMTAQEWLRFAREEIGLALRDRIRDELLLAELEASLSSDERLGLLGFVQQLRTNIVSQNFGSASVADRNLLEQEGLTLDEKVRQTRNRELVRMQLQRALGGRTIVSWREVLQAYERDSERFRPPPVATLRMIWTAANDAETAVAIGERLRAGEPFESIASDASVNSYRAGDGGLHTVALSRDGYAESRIFSPEPLDQAARSLSPGETTGPFDFNGRSVWITLERIEDNASLLYDVQLTLYDELLSQRFTENQARYFGRLIERGSLSDIADMERRLFELAAERYLIAAGALERR